MIRRTKVTLAASLLIAALTISAGVWLAVRRGFSAREQPGAIEAFVARSVRILAMPRAAKNAQNPVAASSEVLFQAMAHFADHCASCHANDGSGETPIGKGLYPKPPDMRQAGTQRLTDGELFHIIHNGIRLTGMPAFGQETEEPDLDSWKLVHFIRRLPNITPEELARMKDMNPKSRHEIEEEEAIRRFLEGDDSQPLPPSHKHD
jgi:mono/diheme cytochrome c family protein